MFALLKNNKKLKSVFERVPNDPRFRPIKYPMVNTLKITSTKLFRKTYCNHSTLKDNSHGAMSETPFRYPLEWKNDSFYNPKELDKVPTSCSSSIKFL